MAPVKRMMNFNRENEQMHSRKLASSPNFFKPVIRPLVQGMQIPVAFMRKYGDSLWKVAVLEVPTGSKWRVAVCNVDGETWFGEGLEEFGEFYSIKEAHVLVFRYQGNSRFKVLIFDTTHTEIDYPVKSHHKEAKNGHYDPNMIFEDVSIKRENVDKIENCGKPNHGLRSRRKVTSAERTSSKAPRESSMDTINMVKKKKITEDERARERITKNPCFSFSVVSSQISHPQRLYVPIDFARKNFGEEKCKVSMELRLPESGNESWPVRFSIYGRRSLIYGKGWNRFTEENRLKLGEIFIFELIRERKVFNAYRRA